MAFLSKNAQKTLRGLLSVLVMSLMIFTSAVIVTPTIVSAEPGDQVTAINDSEEYITVNGNGWTYQAEDLLAPLRIDDMIVYCLDDGVRYPDQYIPEEGLYGTPYTEFDISDAPDLQDDTTLNTIKKILYYGAPNDGGNGELVAWLMENGASLNGHQYTEEEAKQYLEFMTGALLHNITNPIQGVGFNGDNTPEADGIETYKILDQVIDSQTGEFINNAVGRNSVYDLMAQKFWKKVLSAPDSIADLVTLKIFTPTEQMNTSRPENRHDSHQRVIGAEITPNENPPSPPIVEVGSLCISKTVTGENAPADTEFTFTVSGLPEGSFSYNRGEQSGTISNNGTITLKGGESATIEGIPANTNYTVTESDLPENWSNTSKSGDTGTIQNDQTATASFTNTYTNPQEPGPEPTPDTVTVKISKADLNGTEIAGATIRVTKADGTFVEEWTSTTEPEELTVEPGDYILVETNAPEGYVCVTTEIPFSVEADGNVTLGENIQVEPAGACYVDDGVLVLADAIEVKISKTDLPMDDAEAVNVVGAKLSVDTAEGSASRPIDSWTSSEEPHSIFVGPGQYTLSEISAPDGFIRVETTIGFTVASDGTVTVTTLETIPANAVEFRDGVLILKNKANPTVDISKTDAATSKELPGAKLKITKKVSGELVAEHTSTNETWKVQLAPGEYTLTEVTAPDGYEVAESIDFTVDENGLVGLDKVEMKDKKLTTTPDNTDDETPVTPENPDDETPVTPENPDDETPVTPENPDDETPVTPENPDDETPVTPENPDDETPVTPENPDDTTPVTPENPDDTTPGTPENPEQPTPEKPNEPAPVVEKTFVTVMKSWDDKANAEGRRPDSVTINLLANGVATGETLILSSDNSWVGIFRDLPAKDEAGNTIAYSVSETQVPFYITTITGSQADGFRVKNYNRPWVPEMPGTPGEYGRFTVAKTVAGGASKDRAYEIQAKLTLPDGTVCTEKFSIKPTDDAYVFDGLAPGTKVEITEVTTGYHVTYTVNGKEGNTFNLLAGDDVRVVVLNDDALPPNTPGKTPPKTPDVPKTGDESKAGMWIGILAIAVLLAVLAALIRIRTKK